MTNTPHTPGPWHVAHGKIARDILHLAIMADNGDMPCSVTPMDVLQPIDEANAQLIALAPTLLAQRNELREALKNVMRCFVGDRNSKNSIGELGIIADQARAALAKANP